MEAYQLFTETHSLLGGLATNVSVSNELHALVLQTQKVSQKRYSKIQNQSKVIKRIQPKCPVNSKRSKYNDIKYSPSLNSAPGSGSFASLPVPQCS